MRERVRHFRGNLVIECNASGTRVYATLPLRAECLNCFDNAEDIAFYVPLNNRPNCT
jgi:signal transduction histidine kinase